MSNGCLHLHYRFDLSNGVHTNMRCDDCGGELTKEDLDAASARWVQINALRKQGGPVAVPAVDGIVKQLALQAAYERKRKELDDLGNQIMEHQEELKPKLEAAGINREALADVAKGKFDRLLPSGERK